MQEHGSPESSGTDFVDILPDGWERRPGITDEYAKLVKPDGWPRTSLSGDDYRDDVVIIVTETTTGVIKGPSYRTVHRVRDTEAAGVALVHVVEAWLSDGRDPLGSADLEQRLADAVAESQAEQSTLEASISRGDA